MASNSTLTAPATQYEPLPRAADVPAAETSLTYGRWLLLTFAWIICLVAATAWVNWRADVLGLFGRPDVRRYSLDRYSNYAMSYRFIPGHFDGLLLGNSLTTNWDTSLIPGYRVFNCSMRGANFSEEDLIARNVLVHSHPKMLIILLHPSFTSSDGRLTPYMTPQEYWSSLGSLQMLTIYSQMAMEKIAGPNTTRWTFEHRAFPFGGENFRIPRRDGQVAEPVQEFHVDAGAEKELVALVQTAHHRGIQLYFLIPPTYAERWQIDGPKIKAYYRRMLALASPQDHVIDLNDGALHQITENHLDFPDYTHLSLSAARQASAVMAQRIASTEHTLSASR